MSIRFKIARHAVQTVIVVMTGFNGADVQVAEAMNGSLRPCLAALNAADRPEKSCEYMALLSDTERSDMVRLTRGLLQDASCRVRIEIPRKLVSRFERP